MLLILLYAKTLLTRANIYPFVYKSEILGFSKHAVTLYEGIHM